MIYLCIYLQCLVENHKNMVLFLYILTGDVNFQSLSMLHPIMFFFVDFCQALPSDFSTARMSFRSVLFPITKYTHSIGSHPFSINTWNQDSSCSNE